MSAKRLFDYFDAIRIINLASRSDRRQEVGWEFGRLGLTMSDVGAEFFEAVAPKDSGGFPSVGARGCFLSHLRLLEEFLEGGAETLLVLEDDVSFIPDLNEVSVEILDNLERFKWDIAYIGYELYGGRDFGSKALVEIPAACPVSTTHSYAIRREAAERLVEFLKELLGRQPGDPIGGPMHVDGAISRFRSSAPDLVTVLSSRKLTFQRPSRSDIAGDGCLDRLRLLDPFMTWARRIKHLINR